MSFSSDNPLQTNQVPTSQEFPAPDHVNFIDTLSLSYKRLASAINTKENSLYLLQETASFNQYFTTNNPQQNRNVYRSVFDMVSLNGGAIGINTKASFAHNITGINSPTNLYGAATTSTANYISLPYISVKTESDEIQIYATATDIVLVTGATIDGGDNSLTQAYIVFEYTKN